MPTLDDDGSTITLDLHGATIAEARELTYATVALAAERGRSHIRIIHGSSTSSSLYRNRTIRHALYDMLERGDLDSWVTSALRSRNDLMLSLDVTTASDPTPISLLDVRS